MCFISEYWRFLHQQAGLDVRSSEVIYGGVAPETFHARRLAADYADGPLRLLYAGYIDLKRGLHTIVEALGVIPAAQRHRIHLSVAYGGPVVPDDYVSGIRTRITQLGLSPHVTFLGRVPHAEMPAVYGAHHALVFASVRDEGMPMVMMEAMCAGCAVPNTGSGGAIELAERAETPLFPKDHPFALSRLLSALESDRARVAEVALRGQQTVLNHFTIDRMLKQTAEAIARAATRAEQPGLIAP
jgi:glycosyltransferase involved in cell wall biosynthesis